MTQEDKNVSARKTYTKPGLINYGDLSILTTTNSMKGALDGGPSSAKTGPATDVVDETFERFDGSSDYSRRGGASGGEGAGRGG